MKGTLIDSPQIAVQEFFLAKNAAEMLHKHYPGHLWAVAVDGPFLDVRNLYLSGDWGFRVSIPTFYSASEWDKQVMRAGGELLERYRQTRGHATDNIHTLPTDFSGRHKPEL
jgi:hypothetical protein